MKIDTYSLNEINNIGQALENFYRNVPVGEGLYFVEEVQIVDQGGEIVGFFRFDAGDDHFKWEPREEYFS